MPHSVVGFEGMMAKLFRQLWMYVGSQPETGTGFVQIDRVVPNSKPISYVAGRWGDLWALTSVKLQATVEISEDPQFRR
jgi:hypothetical protein